MAKKNDAAYEAFLADLKAINPQIEEIVKDEKVAAKLREATLARSEFSQSMDALKAERTSFESEVAEAKQKIAGWQDWYGRTTQEVAGIQGELQKYRDTYGDLTPAEQGRAAKEAGMTKAELESYLQTTLQNRDVANLKFATDLVEVSRDFDKKFREELPTEELYKLAGEQGVSLKAAYKLFIADRVETQRKTEFDEAIKKAKIEGAAEFASSHNLPQMTNHSDMVHSLDVQGVSNVASDRVKAAVAGFLAGNKR